MAVRNLLAQVTQRGARFGGDSGQFVAPELGDKVFDKHSSIFARRKDTVNARLCTMPIPSVLTFGRNAGMQKNNYRKQWLRILRDQEGGVRELADKLETDPNYLSSILGPNAKREVGDVLARKVEQVFKLTPGVLDAPSEAALKIINVIEGMSEDELAEVLEFAKFKKATKN